MNQVPQAYRILPELLLTVAGILIMLIEPVMPPGMTRKPIGFLALAGVIAALIASVWQLGLPAGRLGLRLPVPRDRPVAARRPR